MLPQNSFHEILPNSILHMMMILQKIVKNGNNSSQPMRMSWMNPWAFCPLLISAVGILLTTEVPSVNQYSYLPLNNPLLIYKYMIDVSLIKKKTISRSQINSQVVAVFLAYSRTSVVMASGRELCYVLLLGDFAKTVSLRGCS